MPSSLEEKIHQYTKGSGTFINEKFWHAVLGYWLTEDAGRARELYNLMGLVHHGTNLVFHSPAKSINSDLLVVTPSEFALVEVKVSGRWQHYQRLLYAHQIHALLLREPELFRDRVPVLIVIGHERHLRKFPAPLGILSVQHESVKEHRISATYLFNAVTKTAEVSSYILDYRITLNSATRNLDTQKPWREKDQKRLAMLQEKIGQHFHLEVRLVSWERLQSVIGAQILPLERFWLK